MLKGEFFGLSTEGLISKYDIEAFCKEDLTTYIINNDVIINSNATVEDGLLTIQSMDNLKVVYKLEDVDIFSKTTFREVVNIKKLDNFDVKIDEKELKEVVESFEIFNSIYVIGVNSITEIMSLGSTVFRVTRNDLGLFGYLTIEDHNYTVKLKC